METSKFEKYAKQTIKVKINGDEIEMYPIQADIARLMSATTEEEVTEKSMETWLDAVTHMIARENLPHIMFTNKEQGGKYPYYKVKGDASSDEKEAYRTELKGIKRFVTLKSNELLQKIPVEFGWASQKKMDEKLKELEKKG